MQGHPCEAATTLCGTCPAACGRGAPVRAEDPQLRPGCALRQAVHPLRAHARSRHGVVQPAPPTFPPRVDRNRFAGAASCNPIGLGETRAAITGTACRTQPRQQASMEMLFFNVKDGFLGTTPASRRSGLCAGRGKHPSLAEPLLPSSQRRSFAGTRGACSQ